MYGHLEVISLKGGVGDAGLRAGANCPPPAMVYIVYVWPNAKLGRVEVRSTTGSSAWRKLS